MLHRGLWSFSVHLGIGKDWHEDGFEVGLGEKLDFLWGLEHELYGSLGRETEMK